MAKPRTRRDDVQPLTRGIYTARLATTAQDVASAQRLRHLCFHAGRGLSHHPSDVDTFDAACQHVLVTDHRSNDLVCCYRVMTFTSGRDISASYSAQFYDLTALHAFALPMMELGRFCLRPGCSDPDIVRVAWAALTRLVDQAGVAMLFGCSSFDGADWGLHRAALGYLARHHLPPARLRLATRAAETVDMAPLAATSPDQPPALPSLLRTYLAMGGWVSDRAVIDRELNTLHVFTGLDVATVPQARARALRALAGTLPHATS
jgi:L-ornithine Nalpha-acyltransferase